MSLFLPLDGLLTAAQQHSTKLLLAEESQQRRHLVVAISGAHAYGFPSPDSDVDAKAIHFADSQHLLGLDPPEQERHRLEVVHGVEVDYTSNEVAAVLRGVLAGNGNYIERILGHHFIMADPCLTQLKPLVRRSLSKRLVRHYAGFARGQWKKFEAAEQPEVKKALYVLRTALTGAHLLRHGQLVTDVRQLLDEYGFADAAPLIAAKTRGERVVLNAPERAHWQQQLTRAFDVLNDAHKASALPAEAPNRQALNDWLVAIRRQQLVT